jgi:hypothetical protein
MDSQRYAFKLPVLLPCDVPPGDLILFFHRNIQEALPGETYVDVTDYSHVTDGPGVMLICHEAHYSMDRAGGRLGLKCATKRGASGDIAERIRRVIKKTLRIAAAMEGHEVLGGRVRFDTSSAALSIEDRLLAPNNEETFAALAPVLAEVVTAAWGAPPVLRRAGSPKECFQVEISAPGKPEIADLTARLEG